MAALLDDLRALGFELHFAGVDLSAEEKGETRKVVDRWIHDFVWPYGGRRPPAARIRYRLCAVRCGAAAALSSLVAEADGGPPHRQPPPG
jgi:hypothetical protein